MTISTKGLLVLILVAGVLVGAVVFDTQVGTPTSTTVVTSSPTTTTSSKTTTAQTSLVSPGGLRLALSVDSYSNGSLQVRVSEFNTLGTSNNLTKADSWAVEGLSLGSCPTGIYPFGLAVFRGSYTSANATNGSALPVFPVVPCPMLVRLITGYLFLPVSDKAVILPSFSSNQTTSMAVSLMLNGEYTQQSYSGQPMARPFASGTYTIVAGDEWGGLVVLQVEIGGSGASTTSMTTSSTTKLSQNGMLLAQVSVGPIEPVCSANSSVGPAPSQFSHISAVVVSSGRNVTTVPLNWMSNGCSVFASAQISLATGGYSLVLSSCPFMGCSTSLPKAFTILQGQTTDVAISIDTGIR